MSIAEKFLAAFSGARLDAYGTYVVKKTRHDGKKDGSGSTLWGQVTERMVEDHLNGKRILGLIPVAPPGLCRYGMLDIDVYPYDHDAFAERAEAAGLPCVHIRSKSGGAHIYFFLNETVDASLVREQMVRIATELGLADCEKFPKQVTLTVQEMGNYVNLPYFGGVEGGAAMSYDNFSWLSVEEFVEYVEERRISLEQLSSFSMFDNVAAPTDSTDDPGALFVDGPPCLVSLARLGVGEGMRNNFMAEVCLYANKRFGPHSDEGREFVYLVNQSACRPPLPTGEVDKTFGASARRKKYACKREPLQGYCQSSICSTRRYGVAADDEESGAHFPQIVSIETLKTDPPMHTIRFEGYDAPMRIDTRTMFTFSLFQQKWFDVFSCAPPDVSAKQFKSVMRAAMDNIQVVNVTPEEMLSATPKGMMFGLMREYILGRHTEETDRESLMAGRAIREDEDTYYFTLIGFQKFLKRSQFRGMNDSDVFAALTNSPAFSYVELDVKGRSVGCYKVSGHDLNNPQRLLEV